jgi:uncharacterized protein (DUF1015 family)
MVHIAPFRALVYDPEVAGPLERLTAPPYDVIGADRRNDYLAREQRNIAHVDLPAPTGAKPAHYERAAEYLAAWREEGALRLMEPSYFAYEMSFTRRGVEGSVRGLIASMDLHPFGEMVLPHEDVMQGPVDDRLELLRATRTNISPIYGAIAGPCEPLCDALVRAMSSEPILAMTDREEVLHRVWPLYPDGAVAEAIVREPLLIADGHHRYTTALAYRQERRAEDGHGPWDAILALIVDAGAQDVPVLPYHRLQLEGPVPSDGERVASLEHALEAIDDDRLTYATVTRPAGSLHHETHRLVGEPPTVRALHDQHLDAAAPGDLLAFTHDAGAAEDAVRRGEVVAAYLLPPTTPARIRSAVGGGRRLPRKSTFFWPKPRTGLVMMPLDDQASVLPRPQAATPARTPPSS